MSTKVELCGLGKTYRGADEPVVADLDVVVEPGTLLALLGPSGCGKTTTLKMVAGLLDPSEGDVRFDGASVLDQPAEARSVAMVFQKPLLFPHMTVADNVAFGLRMRKVDATARRRRVAEALDRVRLPDLGSRRPHELSGGQEQRVALARALVTEPSLLLLDEPFSQLDANLRVEMRELVRGLQRDLGVTTLFVTHDQEEAVVLADTVGLMLDGRLHQLGTPADFYERPASARVARFFGTSNLLPGHVRDGAFDLGPLAIPLPGPARPGPALLAVRQEAVRLTTVTDESPGALGATVTATTYVGTHLRVAASTAAGEIHATAPATTRLAPGDRIRLCLDPDRCWVVPPDGA